MTEPVRDPSIDDLAAWNRTFAPRAFNRTWELLDSAELTPEQEEAMLAATFAQRFHWYEVGNARNRTIADWQVSRDAAVLGYADLARRFAQRSLDDAVANELGPFVVGFAHEAIARAAEVDDVETFTTHLDLARAQLADVDDPEDRDILQSDLAEMSER